LERFPGALTIGRATLAADDQNSEKLLRGSLYSLTKHSLLLMERIAVCVHQHEPVLLVGETGNGKTAVVQHLAHQVGKKLMVQNLNQQSDSSDLLGGFKPVDLRSVCVPLMNSFGALFPKTFSRTNNGQFIAALRASFDQQKWSVLVRLLRQSLASANKKLGAGGGGSGGTIGGGDDDQEMSPVDEGSRKRRPEESAALPPRKAGKSAGDASPNAALKARWAAFATSLGSFERKAHQVQTSFCFASAEGSLVKALREVAK
jgi:midasin